jgi:hypothetical protein
MFAVIGFVMWIGADIGDNEEAARGNMILAMIMTVAALTALRVGMSMRAKMNARIETAISGQLSTRGYVEASTLAAELKLSMDDARDVLDKRRVDRGWSRTELEQYNARYFPG